MSLTAPMHAGFRPLALTVAALAVAGGTAFTAQTVFADTPARGHTPAAVTPLATAPGYVSSIDGLNPVEREAALKLQRLRAEWAAQIDACHGPANPPRAC